MRRQADDLDAGTNQQVTKRRGVLRVPIEDDEPLVRPESVERIGEVSPDIIQASHGLGVIPAI